MAELNLKAYTDYIRDRLERGALDEVIAQCRHVLETYPKYIEIYKLLGQALMEKQVYQDALDIFQRVLSADPTDFVAHIGMSDCYREQGAIDAAIWHLERAFEQVPNNRDVEEELLKLYELREGQQPRQIARTAGGLARLYARGKLYEQAIPELRKAIAQDPSRLDLQALLVDVLWQARERIEAGKVAADLLRSLPNCITANATLARLWLLAEQPKEARPFLVQLKELDPYLAYRIEHGKAAPSDAFRLTSLDISTVTPSRSQMDDADWLADLGGVEKRAGVTGPLKPDVITDIFTEEDVAPDWLKPSSNPIQSAPPAQRSESQASDDDPDWLRETLMEETPPGMPPVPKASPAAPASPEAPDWLREIMSEDQPSQPVESGGYDTQEMLAAIQAEEDDTDIPDWLAEQTPSQPTEQQSAEQEAIIDQPAETDIPDWLSEDLSDSQSSPPSAQPTIEEDDTMSDDMFDDDVPDWLSEGDLDDADAAMAWLNEIAAKYDPDFQAESSDAAPAEPAPAAAGSDDDLPDWLKGEASAGDDDLPDWLKDMDSPAEPAAPPSPPEPAPAAPASSADDDLPDWLKGDAPAAAAGDDDLPDWLQDEPTPAAPAPTPPAPEPAPAAPASSSADDDLPDWLKDEPAPQAPAPRPPTEPVSATPVSPSDEDDLPDWLKGDAPAAAAGDDDLPDWLKDEPAPQAPEPEPAAPEPAPAAQSGSMDSEDIPDWMSEGALDDEDAALAWLNEIAAKYDPDFDASAAAAEPTPEPAATDAGSAETDPMITEPPTMEVDDLPDWLKDEPAPAAEDDDMPDWLREPTEAAVSEAEDDLPDWLKGEAPAQPTAPPPAARSEDAMSWLDQQVSKQGVDPSGIVSEELTADEPPQPEMPFIPDPDAVATEAADEELPAWMRDIDEAALEPSVEEEIEIPELDIEEDELASLDAALGLEDTQADDLDAIFGVETTTEPEPAAPPAPEPEPQAPAAPPEPEPAAESVPSWLSGTQEVQPVSDDLEAFLRATEPAAAPEPEPAAPETAQPEPVSEPEPVAAEPAGTFGGPRTTSMLPDLTRAPVPSGQGAEIIQQARQLVKANNYEEALRSYERLISAEQLLPDTISDLRNVLKARPSARARRLLGDALMMQGSLQDALEAYRSALDEL